MENGPKEIALRIAKAIREKYSGIEASYDHFGTPQYMLAIALEISDKTKIFPERWIGYLCHFCYSHAILERKEVLLLMDS
jgi:hypothetical protein